MPAIVSALEEAVRDATAGDPITGLRWTHKATRKIARWLQRQGFSVSHTTIARLLRQANYSLRTNRKTLARTHEPDRDRQFRLIARQRRHFLRHGWPVISIDTKKKELVGNFKNPGACWRPASLPVLDHDFLSSAEGRAIPFGIYNEGLNLGCVVVGVSRETPAFACAALERWWWESGFGLHPRATRLLIHADCGGANSNRTWAWKAALQRLADATGLTITVAHYPSGASKWNPIEHRMFSLISKNWAGQPLVSYETVLNFIRTTRSSTGYMCRAWIDTRTYPTGVRVSAADKSRIRIRFHKALPKWNYTIRPKKQ
jgi:Rhodopirellula transposase DDE domain